MILKQRVVPGNCKTIYENGLAVSNLMHRMEFHLCIFNLLCVFIFLINLFLIITLIIQPIRTKRIWSSKYAGSNICRDMFQKINSFLSSPKYEVQQYQVWKIRYGTFMTIQRKQIFGDRSFVKKFLWMLYSSNDLTDRSDFFTNCVVP